jgi:DNA-binding NtrC family response regulator
MQYPTSSERASALVVEDDNATRLAVAAILQAEDYTTVAVGRISEARILLRNVHPSVIVLDLLLEGEDGRELLDELADAKDSPPTVIVSGSRDAAEAARKFHVPLVPKPFDLADLLCAVRDARNEVLRPRRRTPPPAFRR